MSDLQCFSATDIFLLKGKRHNLLHCRASKCATNQSWKINVRQGEISMCMCLVQYNMIIII